MIGNAGGVAGAGVGAEGLEAAVGSVLRHEERHPDRLHLRPDAGRDVEVVDQLPLAIEADGPDALRRKGRRERGEAPRQLPERRRLRRVVEVAHYHYSFLRFARNDRWWARNDRWWARNDRWWARYERNRVDC